MHEAPLHRQLQRIEVVVGVVGFQAERSETGERTMPRSGVNPVGSVPVKKMMAFASGIAELEKPALRELLLYGEIPVLVVQILAMTIDRLGAVKLVCRIEERGERIGQRRIVRRRKRITRHGAFGGVREIVVLIGAIVDSE